jgi:hypothetical protein
VSDNGVNFYQPTEVACLHCRATMLYTRRPGVFREWHLSGCPLAARNGNPRAFRVAYLVTWPEKP